MPAFKLHGMLVYFAAFKNHYSVFFAENFSRIRKRIKTPESFKGNLKIYFHYPVLVGLITKFVKFSAKTNLEKLKAKKKFPKLDSFCL